MSKQMTARLLDKPFSTMTREERETVIDYADSIKRADYFNAVRSMADDARHTIKLGNVTDADELREWVEQSVDGCHWTTCTYANFEVLRWSENHDAYTDDFGGADVIKDGAVNWPVLVYEAMLADVLEELGDLDELFSAEDDEDLPPCVVAMGCYCAGHARGNPSGEPCDTSEQPAAGQHSQPDCYDSLERDRTHGGLCAACVGAGCAMDRDGVPCRVTGEVRP